MNPLRIILVKDGEPLPQLCRPWTLRTGNLARELSRRGHDVTWYSSTFMHYEKKHYCQGDLIEEMPEGYRMHLLAAGEYSKNISAKRLLHHLQFGYRLWQSLRSQTSPPDLVVCCIPAIEAAAACLLYTRWRRLPLILDIRDPWPEVIVAYSPPRLQKLLRFLASPYFALSRRLFCRAKSLTSCSQSFLSWAQGFARRTPVQREFDRVFYHGAHEVHGQIPPEPVLPTTGLRTLFAGSISRGYDLEPVLSVAAKLAAQPDPPHFFLAGQGDRYDSLLSRYGALPNVTFMGWLPRAKVYALAQTCHVGWLPLGEGTEDYLPNKVFEHASMGMATAVPTLGEAGRMVCEHGMGFTYRDQNELFSILSQLRPDENPLQRWKENGLAFFREQGDAKVCSNSFADHVEAVAMSAQNVSKF